MKKFISITLSLIFSFTLPLYAFAESSNDDSFIWTAKDGTTIQYYLDENGLPYIKEENKKTYIGLPLPQFKITDESVLDELNAEIQNIGNDDGIMATAVPTSYIDLTVNPKTPSKSISYSNTYSFANYTTHTTPVFKMNPNHFKIRFRTKNIKKPIRGSSEVSFVINFYDHEEQTWYKFQYNYVKCTSLYGYDIGYTSSCNYAKYILLIPNDVTSYTGEFWTTYD